MQTYAEITQTKLSNLRIGIIASTIHPKIVNNLISACKKGFDAGGIKPNAISTYFVPGAAEIPLFALKLAESGNLNILIALGCVIAGETDHYQQVCTILRQGILEVQFRTGIPIIFEVLTVHNKKQALDRSSLTNLSTNKGYHAARASLELLAAFKKASFLK